VISLLCPTRERPRNLRRLVRSAAETASPNDLVELVLYVDEDDATTRDALGDLATLADRVEVVPVVGPPVQMSDMWNRCADAAATPALVFIDDEAVFRTHGWNTELCAALYSTWPDRIGLVHPNDGVHGEQLSSYFCVHEDWVRAQGFLTPPYFSYGYADVWNFEVANAIGRRVYLPDVVIENMAPKDQPPDHVHRANHERDVRDRNGDRYLATQPDREEAVRRLRAAMTSS